jgi:alpha-maltose-1-phosphate synthase
MRVVLSTIGRFHTFDLARQLHARGALQSVFTGYPRFKLQNERLPAASIRTYPWIHAPYMAAAGIRSWARGINRHWEVLDRKALDAYVSRRLPECDVFVGLSGSALRTGKVAQRRGAKYVCDRGSTHISSQNQLLREEHELWGRPFRGIDPRIMEQEMAEYATADCVTVPSSFNVRTFISQGVPAAKIKLLPYGVDLSRFNRTGTADASRFDILFAGNMSLRKGLQYLLRAYQLVQHPLKSLTLAGSTDSDFIAAMQARSLWPDDVRVLGHVAQPMLRDIMSRSHVLVLPSIEEGLAMVQAQAMACACPVIATENTGSRDLFDDAQEGFIVPIRSAEALAQRLQQLADDPALRQRMSEAALDRVKRSRGWNDYGDLAVATYRALAA